MGNISTSFFLFPPARRIDDAPTCYRGGIMAHTREFKATVIKQIIAGGKSRRKIAEEVGIGRSNLVK